MQAMDDAALEFLQQLLETPGPSGYEAPVQDVVQSYVAPWADEVRRDTHGNLFAIKNAEAPLRLMFDGHCDQIGLLISQIDESGMLYSQPIGGWDPQQLIGQRVTVWSAQGPTPGVIARKPIHLLEEAERKQVVKLQDLWIDIGAETREDAESVVRVGDAVTLSLGMQRLRNGLVTAAGLDNASGLWVVIEAFRRAAASDQLDCGLVAVSTVQEEIGLRGAKTAAFAVDPHVAIAVDVTHATDCPTIDRRQLGEIKVGGGPVVFRGPNMNPVVSQRLLDLGDQRLKGRQLAAIARATPNDANSLQISRDGVATGLVSIPNRYMHSQVEVVSLHDLDQAAELLAAFATTLRETDDFTPR